MQPRNPNNSRGMDVSHYQTVSSWQRVKDSGIDFVLIKASQGADVVDPSFHTHVSGAQSVGLPAGAYHYLDAGDAATAIAEAEHFAATIAGIPFELDPELDVEDKANTPEAALAFLRRFEELTGIRPTVYTYPSFIDDVLGSALSGYRLHLAYYNADGSPADRGGWTEWTYMQYSEHGYVPGVDGPVDLDEFNGRVEDVLNEIEQLKAQVADLQGQYETLLKTAENHVERINALETAQQDTDAPEWFTEEFGQFALKGIVNTPRGPYLFWRLAAIAYRLARKFQTKS